jgi:hypothetical protein
LTSNYGYRTEAFNHSTVADGEKEKGEKKKEKGKEKIRKNRRGRIFFFFFKKKIVCFDTLSRLGLYLNPLFPCGYEIS